MKVTLAGYNIDTGLLDQLRNEEESATPEVISASYARISRDPREISELRRDAREQVEKARRSNEKIVFGLGHSSVAEHAVFNFDIIDISRLAVEYLESFRLAAYTEKSQRYIRIGRDFILPEEIKAEGLEKEFRKMIDSLAGRYEVLYERIVEKGLGKSVAKEDARYLLPLATGAQLGMTVNARELEYMASRMASHRLDEIKKLASELTERSRNIAPSLIRYPEADEYFSNRFEARDAIARIAPSEDLIERGVTLVSAPDNCDELLASALLFSCGSGGIEFSAKAASRMTEEEKRRVVGKTMQKIEPHDSVWREFEFISFIFEASVSASCFAQLKRHRMATVISQRYLPDAPVVIPESASGCEEIFEKAAEESLTLYSRIEERAGREVAEYALLNAHGRRVLLGMNLREIYHFSRLRSDRHAQWEIRELSRGICTLVREEAPISAVLLGGKDSFEEIKKNSSG